MSPRICQHCKRAFKTQAKLDQHRRIHHQMTIDIPELKITLSRGHEGVFSCVFCDFSSSAPRAMVGHIASNHAPNVCGQGAMEDVEMGVASPEPRAEAGAITSTAAIMDVAMGSPLSPPDAAPDAENEETNTPGGSPSLGPIHVTLNPIERSMGSLMASLPTLSPPDLHPSPPMEGAEIYRGTPMGEMERPPVLRNLGLAIDPTYRILVCEACRHGIQRTSVYGHFKHKHPKSRQFPFDIDQVLDELKVAYDVAAPTEIVRPIPSIPVLDGHKCIRPGCPYAAPRLESVKRHHRKEHGGEAEEIVPCLVQKVLHSPIQFWAVDDLYDVLHLEDEGRKHILDSLMAARSNQQYLETILTPSDARTIPQYLKDWEWVDRIQGCNVKLLNLLVSFPELGQFGGALRRHVSKYFEQNKMLLSNTHLLMRRHLNTDEGPEISHHPFKFPEQDATLDRYLTLACRLLSYAMRYIQDETRWGLDILFTDEQKRSAIELGEALESGADENDMPLYIHRLFWNLLFTVHPSSLRHSHKCPIATFVLLINVDQRGQFATCASICGKVSALLFLFRVGMLKEIDIRLESAPDPAQGFKIAEQLCLSGLREGHPTPFDTVRSFTRLATTIAMNEEHLPTMAWDEDHEGFTVMGEYVRMAQIPKMYDAWLHEVQSALDEMCPKRPLPTEHATDNLRNETPGYSFLDSDRALNDECRSALSMVLTPEYLLSYEQSKEPEWIPTKAIEYMRKAMRVNVLLLLLLHIGSGSPARSTEILSLLFRNGQNSRRGVFILGDGLMWMTNSSTRREKFIPRFPHIGLASQLLRYLLYVRPVEEEFSKFLWGQRAYEVLRHHLFYTWEGGIHKTSDSMSQSLKKETLKHLNCELNVSKWRHAQCGISRLLNLGIINPEGEDRTEFSDAQSGKETSTALSIYSIEVGQVGTLCELKMARFQMWSRLYQTKFLHLPARGHVSSLKNILDPKYVPTSIVTDEETGPAPPVIHAGRSPLDSTFHHISPQDIQTIVNDRIRNYPSQMDISSPVPNAPSTSGEPRPPPLNFPPSPQVMDDSWMPNPPPPSRGAMNAGSSDAASAGESTSLSHLSQSPRPPSKQHLASKSPTVDDDSFSDDKADAEMLRLYQLVSYRESVSMAMQPPPNLAETIEEEDHDLLRQVLQDRRADFRVLQQYQTYRLIKERRFNFFWIAPTGIGKTLPFILAMRSWPQSVVGVIVVPFMALRHDMVRRMRAAGLSCDTLRKGNVCPDVQVIVCGLSHLNGDHFKNHLSSLANARRLGAIMYDEAHGLLDDSQYRPEYITALRFLLGLTHTVVFMLSGTMPPQSMPFLFEEKMGLGVEELGSFRTLRLPTNRLNLFYQLSSIQIEGRVEPNEAGGRIAINLARQLEKELKDDERGLVVFVSKTWCSTLSEENRYPCIHGDVEASDRSKILEAYRSGKHKVLCINKACIEGIDFPRIRFVIHANIPKGLLDWAQASGRGGRDGEPCLCLTLNVVYRSGRVKSNTLTNDEESHSGSLALQRMLRNERCLRHDPSTFLDGETATCASLSDKGALPCSFCIQNHGAQPPPCTWAYIRPVPTFQEVFSKPPLNALPPSSSNALAGPSAVNHPGPTAKGSTAVTASRYAPYKRPQVKRAALDSGNFVTAAHFLLSPPTPHGLNPTSAHVDFSSRLIHAANRTNAARPGTVADMLETIGHQQCLPCWTLHKFDPAERHETANCDTHAWEYYREIKGKNVAPWQWKKHTLFSRAPPKRGLCFKCGFIWDLYKFHKRNGLETTCIWDNIVAPIAWMVLNSTVMRQDLAQYARVWEIVESDEAYVRWLREPVPELGRLWNASVTLIEWFYRRYKQDCDPEL
ncbi:hypothetical protein BS47DRAFT_1392880 [Hydnum rufescens UP504]|uniref:DNA 3'-5' helicase n=1 Tax=Hydnum rufescens UP504 TaxID=1448309 RepID=A0A9P6AY75_9AGAM|nr:hypothetical protein BS47DRAFT_1392880 [Hydnum rufescens UP504]